MNNYCAKISKEGGQIDLLWGFVNRKRIPDREDLSLTLSSSEGSTDDVVYMVSLSRTRLSFSMKNKSYFSNNQTKPTEKSSLWFFPSDKRTERNGNDDIAPFVN